MATIIDRGTKKKPLLYALLKMPGGKWKQAAVPKEHRASRAVAQKWADQQEDAVADGALDLTKPKLAGPLLEQWLTGLSNRDAASDRWRARKHIAPRFKDLPVTKLTKGEVVRWLREMKAAGVSGPSAKKAFTILSRFCSWLSADDTIASNPCRDVPTEERPQDNAKKDKPWLADESKARAMMWALPPGYSLMFAVGRTSGMRPSEVVGLRVADTNELRASGVLTVRYSYDTALLKQDKGRTDQTRKKTLAPIHDATVAASLLSLAARRRAAGAAEDDRLFDHLPVKSAAIRRAWARAWKDAAARAGVSGLGWYESTRHSFASKALASKARYEEVSKALGHASVTTTARYYDRHVEREFSTLPTTDVGAALPEAKILPFAVAAGG